MASAAATASEKALLALHAIEGYLIYDAAHALEAADG